MGPTKDQDPVIEIEKTESLKQKNNTQTCNLGKLFTDDAEAEWK